jgi:hypothetical protein
MAQTAIACAIDLLLLERVHEALDLGAVIVIPDAAHAGHDAVRFEQIGAAATGILNAAIGVMSLLLWATWTRCVEALG